MTWGPLVTRIITAGVMDLIAVIIRDRAAAMRITMAIIMDDVPAIA